MLSPESVTTNESSVLRSAFKKVFTWSLCACPLCDCSTPRRYRPFCEISAAFLNLFLLLTASPCLACCCRLKTSNMPESRFLVQNSPDKQDAVMHGTTSDGDNSADKYRKGCREGSKVCIGLPAWVSHGVLSQKRQTSSQRDKQDCHQQNDPSPLISKNRVSGGDVSSFSQHISRMMWKISGVEVD